MAIITERDTVRSKGGSVEYKMTETLAKELLKKRKGTDAKMNPTDYLCKVVNETFGLKNYCVNVILY